MWFILYHTPSPGWPFGQSGNAQVPQWWQPGGFDHKNQCQAARHVNIKSEFNSNHILGPERDIDTNITWLTAPSGRYLFSLLRLKRNAEAGVKTVSEKCPATLTKKKKRINDCPLFADQRRLSSSALKNATFKKIWKRFKRVTRSL